MKKLIILFCSISLLLSACSDDSDEVSFSESVTDASGGITGKGGSLAGFTITGDYLYAVDDQQLEVFNISKGKPTYVNRINVGFGIETIFGRGNTLFLGTQTGMYIYDITSPSTPVQLSWYEHVYACDPVVANDDYAYITLRSSGNRCGRWQNQLIIADIKDLTNPYTLKTYNMVNPKGLGLDGDTLFVCDNGLKVFNISNPSQIQEIEYFGIECHDVIPLNGNLLVIGTNALYQYEYKDNKMNLLSQLTVLD